MPRLSIRISENLQERLIEKGWQIGVDNVSDAVRILLQEALENNNLGTTTNRENNALLHQIINDSVKIRCLLEKAFLRSWKTVQI